MEAGGGKKEEEKGVGRGKQKMKKKDKKMYYVCLNSLKNPERKDRFLYFCLKSGSQTFAEI